jgi:hypothetical protein
MAYTTNWGFTPAARITDRKLEPANLSFGTDFAKTSYKPGEAILSNLTSPLDRVETYRFAVSQVANIYTGTKLDPSSQSQNKRGTAVLLQIRSDLGVTDTDTNSKIILPFEAHLVMRIPQHEAVTIQLVKDVMNRLYGGLYEDGDNLHTARLTALRHGSVLPQSLS